MVDGKEMPMEIARSFRDLRVYKLGRESAKSLFQATRTFPAEERYSLTDQIRRSSRAVNAMIAAAWARRRYEAAFVSKLDETLEEAMETQAWLDHALDCAYISGARFQALDASWRAIGGMLNRMMDRSADFCKVDTRARFGRP
jgi:four helix bundle protein